MRLLKYSIGFLLLVAFATACNSADSKVANQAVQKPASTATPADGAKRVTIEELDALMKEGKAFVVDVRSPDAYNAGHIPGAKLIPLDEIGTRFKELPRDKQIITYCS